ncbi:AAA family ATPase [Butyrivibrio sp. FC2001]|uniref:AAA family ATPase n=1 Tax=Butyrivibrio sp. FC2001 TaxID=1280671 RepID=UPI00040A6ABE|nr:ATP-binding protein [Butyrivibrio sp. FC2001]
MITGIHIENFKSLVDVSLDFNDLTVLIGKNFTGKSSVLQAIDFICSSTKDDFGIWLERRGWRVESVKSKLGNSNRLYFDVHFMLPDSEGKQHIIEWNLVAIAYTTKNEITLFSERVVADDEILLEYSSSGNYVKVAVNKNPQNVQNWFGLKLSSSILKNLRNTDDVDYRLELLIDQLDKIKSFELLTPENMRLSSRGISNTIEANGKNLPSVIKRMNTEQKNRFMDKVRWLLDSQITDVSTETKGQPGWTQINAEEQFGNATVKINSKEMSDGMIRLLAFVAISEISVPGAVFMLDEIENGINSEYAEKLIRLLSNTCKEKHMQMIITTHSTVIMDYVDPEDMILIYRKKDGFTASERVLNNEKFRQKMEYMYPGEIILNTDMEKEYI